MHASSSQYECVEAVTSPALGLRVADLQARMREARITDAEMKTFQKVAAIMEDRHGRIDSDDLVAASFLADPRKRFE
ncbi:hypothetical protein [Mesorhizobium cantuariense]|uniref:Antitoxin VbhA domain-containing protein n=1 Tax=Mesorhizobium cantuariense TaxID=1300275 RepID=A0ABV7MRA0_9HYPH